MDFILPKYASAHEAPEARNAGGLAPQARFMIA